MREAISHVALVVPRRHASFLTVSAVEEHAAALLTVH
jgi:hypothetical protein